MSREQRLFKIAKNYKIAFVVYQKRKNRRNFQKNFNRKFFIRRFAKQTNVNRFILQNRLLKKSFKRFRLKVHKHKQRLNSIEKKN